MGILVDQGNCNRGWIRHNHRNLITNTHSVTITLIGVILLFSHQGCRSYSFESCNHHLDIGNACGSIQPTPECVQECDEGTDRTYKEDLTFGSAYSVPQTEIQIQLEILTNGPVEAAFDVYEDFLTYKSGVYEHIEGDYSGGHAIKILGWGVENDTPYWLIANSWNANWGDAGYFKIRRGVDHCGIESDVTAGLSALQ